MGRLMISQTMGYSFQTILHFPSLVSVVDVFVKTGRQVSSFCLTVNQNVSARASDVQFTMLGFRSHVLESIKSSFLATLVRKESESRLASVIATS